MAHPSNTTPVAHTTRRWAGYDWLMIADIVRLSLKEKVCARDCY